jgi:membrane protein
MIGIVAFIITLSITAGALITSFGPILERWMGAYSDWLLVSGLVVLNIVIHTILFAIAYRHLPDIRLDWRHIWFGALFSALLFVIGKSLIALFITNTQLSDFYDAAGSILMLMLWVFFSSAIFYFGAFIAQSRAEFLNPKE